MCCPQHTKRACDTRESWVWNVHITSCAARILHGSDGDRRRHRSTSRQEQESGRWRSEETLPVNSPSWRIYLKIVVAVVKVGVLFARPTISFRWCLLFRVSDASGSIKVEHVKEDCISPVDFNSAVSIHISYRYTITVQWVYVFHTDTL